MQPPYTADPAAGAGESADESDSDYGDNPDMNVNNAIDKITEDADYQVSWREYR